MKSAAAGQRLSATNDRVDSSEQSLTPLLAYNAAPLKPSGAETGTLGQLS